MKLESKLFYLIALFLTSGMALFCTVQAQSNTRTLSGAKETYEKNHGTIEDSRSAMQQKAMKQYKKEIEKAFAHYRQAGKLEALLVLKKAKQDLGEATVFPHTPTPDLPESVVKVHEVIHKKVLKENEGFDKRLHKLQNQYLKYLDKLKADLTRKELMNSLSKPVFMSSGKAHKMFIVNKL